MFLRVICCRFASTCGKSGKPFPTNNKSEAEDLENIFLKEKLLDLRNFFSCHKCFQKSSAAEVSKSVYMWERVRCCFFSMREFFLFQVYISYLRLHPLFVWLNRKYFSLAMYKGVPVKVRPSLQQGCYIYYIPTMITFTNVMLEVPLTGFKLHYMVSMVNLLY